MSRKTKIYIRTTILFTILFSLVATIIVGGIWINGVIRGRFSDINDTSMQKAYVNTLLCGVDKDGYRTDVLIFAQLNLLTNGINMVQIPRDTYVDINRVDGKINSAYGYNKETQLFKEVEYILDGVDVDKFIMVDIKGFREIVDAIGGVEFNVPGNLKYDDPVQDLHINLKKGLQKLNGKEAEQLVRFRKDNNETDIQTLLGMSREDMQKDFIYTAIDQILSLKNIARVPKLISIASDNVTTNFTVDEMTTYAPMILNINRENINVMKLPGRDSYNGRAWYYIHDAGATRQMVSQYLIPAKEEISAQEIAIRDQLIGDSTDYISIPSDLALQEGFSNRFLTVDVIDGSNGTADIDEIVADIEKYGYRVKDVDEASAVRYSKTVVVAKKDNDSGAKIAKAIGADSFLINPDMRNNASVTVIVGSDMK